MSTLPILPLFVDAYLADTTPLSLEEKGAYSDLLCHMWLHEGWLPDDDTAIARLLRVQSRTWRKLKKQLAPYLMFNNGKIGQKRLLQEHSKALEKREKCRNNAQKKWKKDDNNWKNNNSQNANADASGIGIGICTPISISNSDTNVSADKSATGDAVKNLFDVGVEFLISKGTHAQQARAFIGKLRKDHDDGEILGAILQAQKEQIIEPKAWITAYFKKHNRARTCADIMN